MKRYVILHWLGVAYADGLHQVAEIVATLDCRHYFVIDTLDDPAIFAEMVRSLGVVIELVEDLTADQASPSAGNDDRR